MWCLYLSTEENYRISPNDGHTGAQRGVHGDCLHLKVFTAYRRVVQAVPQERRAAKREEGRGEEGMVLMRYKPTLEHFGDIVWSCLMKVGSSAHTPLCTHP